MYHNYTSTRLIIFVPYPPWANGRGGEGRGGEGRVGGGKEGGERERERDVCMYHNYIILD